MKQRTFALLKPDVAGGRKSREIIHDILDAGFRITSLRHIAKPASFEVDAHLADLKTRIPEAYHRNRGYLIQGPLTALVIEGEDAVAGLRALAGATDPTKAGPGTLRQKYGTDSIEDATFEGRGLRNAIHASDSPEAAEREIGIWIGEDKPQAVHRLTSLADIC